MESRQIALNFLIEQRLRSKVLAHRLRKAGARVSTFHAVDLDQRRAIVDELFELANELEDDKLVP